MQDSYGRSIDYMRVALTDRCNLRCWYYVGREDHKPLPAEDQLTLPEFRRLLRIAVEELGFTKLRLTGGEPLVYPHLEEIITFLRGLKSLQELTLTSNGLLLAEKAKMLRQAGVHRINVSLEGATDDAYLQTTGKACLNEVLGGLEGLLEVGFGKPKINVVLCRWFEMGELERLLEIGERYGQEIRFIELMGHEEGKFPTVTDVVEQYSSVVNLRTLPRVGTATSRYAIEGYDVILGFIPSRTHPFCNCCSRIRLASDGQLRACLFSPGGVQLRPLLRDSATDIQLAEAIRGAVWAKPAADGDGGR